MDNLDLAIRDRRERTDAYLRSAGARRRLLINVAVIAGALATLLTAAPALGGQPFAKWLTGVFGLSSPAWQLLCAVAALCSLAATIATQLLNSHQLDERVAAALTVRAQLETLEIRAGLRQIGPAEAVSELIKCVDGAAFVWPSSPGPTRATGRATVLQAAPPNCTCGSDQRSRRAPDDHAPAAP
jgi:hypothetical protein